MRGLESPWVRRAGWALALLTPMWVVFGPALTYPFLELDDGHYIVRNPALRDLSWEGLRFLFLDDHRDLRYQPLTYLSFAVDYRLFGLDPFYFHLSNLLLHAANTLLVAILIRRLTRDDVAAVVTAMIFSIHPLQVESVAWVFIRKNLLCQLFFLLAAIAYLRARGDTASGRRIGLLWLSSALYALACLSRITAITLPAVLVLFDYQLDPRARPPLLPFLRDSLRSKAVYLAPLVGFFLFFTFRETPNPFVRDYGFSPFEWLILIGHNLFFYVAKTLVPTELGVFYVLPTAGALPPRFALYAALSIALFASLLLAWRKGARGIVLGLGWYLVTIFPLAIILFFFTDLPLLVADRYYYQSSIGLALVVGLAASALWHRASRPRALIAAAVVGGLVLATLSIEHRRTFRNTTALYEQLVAHHPSDEFLYRLALEYQAAGRGDEAFAAAAAALDAPGRIFFMDFLFYRLRLCELHRQRGDFAAAADQLEAGLAAIPNAYETEAAPDPLGYLVLADLRERAGQAEASERARDLASKTSPDDDHYFLRRWIEVSPEASGAFLTDRVAARPEDGRAWFQLAIHASLTGDPSTARRRFARAAELGHRR